MSFAYLVEEKKEQENYCAPMNIDLAEDGFMPREHYNPFLPHSANQVPMLQLFWQHADLATVMASFYLSFHDLSSLMLTCHTARQIFGHSPGLLRTKVMHVLRRTAALSLAPTGSGKAEKEEGDELAMDDGTVLPNIHPQLPFLAGTSPLDFQSHLSRMFFDSIRSKTQEKDWRKDGRLKWIESNPGTLPVILYTELALYLLEGGNVEDMPEKFVPFYQHDRNAKVKSPASMFVNLATCNQGIAQAGKDHVQALRLMAWILDMPEHWVQYLRDPRYLVFYKPYTFHGSTDFWMLMAQLIIKPKLHCQWSKEHADKESKGEKIAPSYLTYPKFNNRSVRMGDAKFYRSLSSHIRLRKIFHYQCPVPEVYPLSSQLIEQLLGNGNSPRICHSPTQGECYVELKGLKESSLFKQRYYPGVSVILWSGDVRLRDRLLGVIRMPADTEEKEANYVLYPMPLWLEWRETLLGEFVQQPLKKRTRR